MAGMYLVFTHIMLLVSSIFFPGCCVEFHCDSFLHSSLEEATKERVQKCCYVCYIITAIAICIFTVEPCLLSLVVFLVNRKVS